MNNALQRGIEAHQRGDLSAAKLAYEQAIGAANHNLAVLHESLGEHEAAIDHFRAALTADPSRHESAAALSLTLLREGRWAEAWPLHERRRHLDRLNLPRPKPDWPEWRGESLVGKRLAVLGEQGFGDQIMFARFLEPLRARGADVRFVTAAPLATLLGGQAEISRKDFDVWTYLLSLPLWFGALPDTLPPPVRLPVSRRGGGGVGVVPTGNPAFYKNTHRTPPDEVQQQMLKLGRDLRPEATGARDFLETAEIVAGLDLVVTIDTAIAHLAGSLGVPTHILLPARDADWRWMRGRSDSPWYPSVRVVRQPAPGDWSGALATSSSLSL